MKAKKIKSISTELDELYGKEGTPEKELSEKKRMRITPVKLSNRLVRKLI